MRARTPGITKSSTKQRAGSLRCSSPLLVVTQRKSGSDRKNAITTPGTGTAPTVQQAPVSKSRDIGSLRDEIYRLIESEAIRMSRLRISEPAFETEAGDAIGQSFFSSAEAILERLHGHGQLNPQECQFLMCAIQAVGFALGTGSSHSGKNARLRRRAKWVAGILADAMERNDLAFWHCEFLGPDLLNRLSSN
jgi:hypothetical protein